MKRLLPALAILMVLVSCNRSRVVLVGPDTEAFGPLVETALKQDGTAGTWTVQSEGATWPADAVVVRLTTSPGWNLPAASPGLVALADSWRTGSDYSPPPSLSRQARNSLGEWEVVPLFYDVWGITRFGPPGTDQAGSGRWDEVLSSAPGQSLAMAGDQPAFRQWAFGQAAAGAWPPSDQLALWFSQPAAPWTKEIASLAPLVHHRAWAPQAWRWAEADLDQLSGRKTNTSFVQTFRAFEASPAGGAHRFSPFQRTRAGVSEVSGLVVAAEFRGPKGDTGAVEPLMRLLAGSRFQREAEVQIQWLAASSRAPELDGTSAAVRRLVNQTVRFLPTTNRLPAPLVADSLLAQVQVAVDREAGR
jgi:hypothetical protein